MNYNQQPLVRSLITAGGLMLGATACGDRDASLPYPTSASADAETNAAIQNIAQDRDNEASETENTPSQSRLDAIKEALTTEVADFKCLTDGADTKTIKIGESEDGKYDFVLRRDNFDLPLAVDETQHDDDHRMSTDALDTYITADKTDKEAVIANAKASLCESRLTLSTYAHLFANLDIEGVKIGEIIPELTPYMGEDDMINDWAAAFPLTTEGSIRTEEDLEAYDKQDQLAEAIAKLMTRFQIGDIENAVPLAYYHLNLVDSLRIDGVPEVERVEGGYEVNNEFLPLFLTLKSGECVPIKVGINTSGDQRPAILPTDCVPTPEDSIPTEDSVPVEGGVPVPEDSIPTEDSVPSVGTTTTTIVEKHDDGELPGDSTPASQDPGTPDTAGNGPANQTPDNSGYIPGEIPPSSQAPVTTVRATTTTQNTVPASTGEAPTSTNPPVEEESSSTSIAPGPRPPKP